MKWLQRVGEAGRDKKSYISAVQRLALSPGQTVFHSQKHTHSHIDTHTLLHTHTQCMTTCSPTSLLWGSDLTGQSLCFHFWEKRRKKKKCRGSCQEKVTNASVTHCRNFQEETKTLLHEHPTKCFKKPGEEVGKTCLDDFAPSRTSG